MGAPNVHLRETGSDGIPIAAPACRRVPSWAALSSDPADVTCAWCRRWLAKRPGTERLRVRTERSGFSIYRVELGDRFLGRVALLTTRRWSATGPTVYVLGERFARRQDAVDALVRHDELHHASDADG